MQKKLLSVLREKKNFSPPPIWLMRQAGRYLPEYREIRKSVQSFLDLCYNPKLAAEVTLQPITRFDFDAAIIFSDILVIADSLSGKVEFIEGKGPQLDIINDETDLRNLKIDHNCAKLANTAETLSLVRSKLQADKTLIGFAGAPWTVAAYMLEGTSKNDFALAKEKCFNKRSMVKKLIEIITEITITYLKSQIKAGADVVQIFDSWAGILGEEEYREFIIEPTQIIVKELKKEFPNTPIIGFPRNSHLLYKDYAIRTGVDGLSLDYNVPLRFAKELQEILPVQGNLDPIILLSNDKKFIEARIKKILDALVDKPFIFNLGHGILPTVPVENVEILVETIRNHRK
ncbi:MAG: hemE [Rickettsiaceae bacterium]|jgi:uroporphyrinogen decarboxylase|nr:hemE [Rickettsiaceae bacterium]